MRCSAIGVDSAQPQGDHRHGCSTTSASSASIGKAASDGSVAMLLLAVSEPKSAKNRVHLDTHCDDHKPGGRLVLTHRTDLWEQQDFGGALLALQESGVPRDVAWSEPSEYMPGNEELADIRIRFVSAAVGPLPDEEYRRVKAPRRPEQDVVLGVWDPVLTLSAGDLDAMVAAMTTTITSPYLSLHGIDPGPEYPGWLADHITGAVAEIWPDHGHYPHLVDPTRFVERVNAFIDSSRS